MSTKRKGKPMGAVPKAGAGPINIDDIVAKTIAMVPANMRPMLDKVVLSGMRIMFDKASHKMALEQLDAPGPMAPKLANGIITLMYMLWTQSNKTIPPQLMVPATLVLTLRAFQFLQESKDPDATREVLGEATHGAVQGVMDRFGATQDRLPALLRQGGQKPGMLGAQAGAGPAAGAGGMLGAGGAQ